MMFQFILLSLDQEASHAFLTTFDKSCPGVSGKIWEKCKNDTEYGIQFAPHLAKKLCLQDNKKNIDRKCFAGLKSDNDEIIKKLQQKSQVMKPEVLEAMSGEVKKGKCEIPSEFKNGLITFKEEMLVTYDFSPSFTHSTEF